MGADGFVLQGDNNNAVDPWMPRATDVAGKAWLVVPGVGRVITIIHQPIVAGGPAAGVMVSLILAGQSRPRPTRRRPCRRADDPRRPRRLSLGRLGEHHDPDLGHVLHRLAQALAAEAGVLDAAVGHVVDPVGRDVVDDDAADLELARTPARRPPGRW